MNRMLTRLDACRDAAPFGRSWRLALAVLLAGLVSGCWMSGEPLIDSESASTVSFGGPYKPEKEDVVVKVTANPDGSYSFKDQKGEGFDAFFRKVQDDWYVAQQDFKKLARNDKDMQNQEGDLQFKVAEGNGPYLYTMMQIHGKDLWFYMPDCDEATAGIKGVTREGKPEDVIQTCLFADVPTLEAAGLSMIQRLKAGEIKDDHNVLQAIDEPSE